MLTQIHLERFKKFSDVKVQLRPFTVLMGENSSGKTTVLQAINLAINTLATHDFIDTSSEKVKVRSKGVGLTSFSGLNLADYKELYYAKIPRGGSARGAGGAIIEMTDDRANVYRLQITSLFGSFNIKCTSKEEELQNSPKLHIKEPLYISGFVGLRVSEERAFPRVLQDRLRSGQVSAIIRNLLLDTKSEYPEAYNRLAQRLAKDFDFYLDDIDFDARSDLFVKANYKDAVGKNSISLDFNSSGSGFMQVLQILASIYLYCPNVASVVLLDEPDAHLHTNLQSSLARALREIQQELGIQIIISTHSTSIIRAADPSEVVPISSSLPMNEPLVSSYDVEQQITNRIDTYDLGKSVISGKILFLEDTNTSILEAFDNALGTRCFSGANTTPVMRGKGKDDKSPFTLNEVLKEFIRTDVEIHFVRDGDGLDQKWRDELQVFSNERNVRLHHLIRHEIENYILQPNLFHKVLKAKHNGKKIPSEKEIAFKMCELLSQTIAMAGYRYESTLQDNIYKTAMLLNKQEYRNQQLSISEAIKTRDAYEKEKEFDRLVVIGMGKQTLAGVMNWLNNDLALKLSHIDILGGVTVDDVPDEIKRILGQLKSKEAKENPLPMPIVKAQEDAKTDEEELDILIPRQLEFKIEEQPNSKKKKAK